MKAAKRSTGITIKPLKQPPKLPDDFYAKNWEKLRLALTAVFSKTPLEGVGKEELYRIVEDVCLHKYGDKLYQQLSQECKEFIQAKVQSLSGNVSNVLFFDIFSCQVSIKWPIL